MYSCPLAHPASIAVCAEILTNPSMKTAPWARLAMAHGLRLTTCSNCCAEARDVSRESAARTQERSPRTRCTPLQRAGASYMPHCACTGCDCTDGDDEPGARR